VELTIRQVLLTFFIVTGTKPINMIIEQYFSKNEKHVSNNKQQNDSKVIRVEVSENAKSKNLSLE
jgi:hypothetical protein